MKLPVIRSLRTLSTKLTANRASVLRWGTLAVAVVMLVGLVMLAQTLMTTPQGAGADIVGEGHLRGQVDTAAGAPRDGRDPAAQPQSGLAAAASKPTGVGQRTDTPAADVGGEDHHHHVTSSDVYGDSSQTGVGSNGCYINYGIPGEQCVPAHAATNGVLTCHGVHKHFSSGVKVSGGDPYHLDTNHNGIACDPSDAH